MISIEFLTAFGDLQVKDGGARYVVHPERDGVEATELTDLPDIVQALAAATRPLLPLAVEHRAVTFTDLDCLLMVDGRGLPPDADVSEESADVQAIHAAVYGHEDGLYADAHAAMQEGIIDPGSPPELSPEQQRALQVSAILNAFAAEVSAIEAEYPQQERETWHRQATEAEAYMLDSGAPTPFIDAMIAENGVPKGEMVGRILARLEAYSLAVGAALGRKQRAMAEMDSEE